MKKAETSASEALLSAIARGSRLFLTAELDLEKAIPSFLEILGKSSRVSRCYLFSNSTTGSGELATSLVYEWAGEGFRRMGDPRYSEIPWVRSGMGRWLEILSGGGSVHGVVEELPGEERKVLEAGNIRSVAVLPVYVNARWWGFMGFADCEAPRRWSTEELEALSIGSAIIEAALERREMESYLLASRSRYKTLLSTIPSLVMNLSADGRICECSDQSAEMLGIPPGEMLGRRIEEVCCTHSGDLVRTELERSFSYGSPSMMETVLSGPGGVPRDVRISVTPVPVAGSETPSFAVVSIEDITAFRKMELENMALEERISRRNRMESMAILAGGIAHDFSGIMSVISWNAKLALRDLPRGSSRASIERILAATERSQELAQQMLAYAGRGCFNPVMVSLQDAIGEICSLVGPSMPEGVTLSCDIPEDLPEIEADSTQMDQLVLNLIKNSMEAMEGRSGVISVRAEPAQCDDGVFEKACYGKPPVPGLYVLLSVSDEGCGMSPNTLSKLFDPFFTTKSRGRGLGLSIVLGIVRAHEGAIRVESEPESGSTFFVYLPLSAGMPSIQTADP